MQREPVMKTTGLAGNGARLASMLNSAGSLTAVDSIPRPFMSTRGLFCTLTLYGLSVSHVNIERIRGTVR